MKHLSIPHSLDSIQSTTREIRRHYERLNLSITFDEFLAHASATAPSFNVPLDLEALARWQPRFFKACVEPTLPLLTRTHRKRARRAAECLGELERALICCVATHPLEARRYCEVHDAHVARHAQEDETTRRRCARGGKERHKGHARVKRLALRFLSTKVPDDLWKNREHAARIVAEYLYPIVLKYRLEFRVSPEPETLEKNVKLLMRRDPRAAQAFESHRRPRPCRPRHSNCSQRRPR